MDHTGTVRAFFDAWVGRDPQVLTAFFAADGEWCESNRPAARGHAAITEVFTLQVSFATDFRFDIPLLAAIGERTVVTERVDSWRLNDTPMGVPVMGVFEFDDAGKITRWRDYYDWADLERQLVAAGVDLTGAIPPTLPAS